MHALLTLALLSAIVTANPVVFEKRQQATDNAQFSSAANQLISLYIPASVAVPLGVAVQSAASAQGVTGDINSIVQSALTATSAPSFLTAIPSQYQSNIASLESAVSALRGAASTGIAGAPRVVTSTNNAGSAVVTTMPGSSVGGVGGVIVTTTDSAGHTVMSTESPGGLGGIVITTTDSSGNTITSTENASGAASSASGSASSAASSAASAASSNVSSVSSSASAEASSASSAASSQISAASSSASSVESSASASVAPNASSSSHGFAAATQIPVIGGAVIGFVGLLAAL